MKWRGPGFPQVFRQIVWSNGFENELAPPMSTNIQTLSRRWLDRVPLWPAIMVPVSTLCVWAINAGGQALRGLMLSGLGWLLALPLLVSLEAGLFSMMLFEPVRGFLRRAQYIFIPYSQTDPIHIITPIVTLMAFVMLLHRERLGLLWASPLARLVSILAFIYFIEIFNPLQGGLGVGFSGALFVLVPLVWFYFGQTIKPQFIETVFRIVVVLGIITSLYGLYQLVFGFPSFEQYWVDNTEFYKSISVGNVQRALATFCSAEEWGRYIEVGALIAFGFATDSTTLVRRAAWSLAGSLLTIMVLLTGQRTAMFGLILGIVVLLLLGARTWRAAVGRSLLVLIPMVLLTVLVKAPTYDDILSHSEDDRIGTVLAHTASGTLRPTEEGSLQERFKNWTYLATDVIPYRPFGLGLGATNLGASRFESDIDLPPIDSHFIATVLSCGLLTALLFFWILFRAASLSWRTFRRADPGSAEARVWRVAATLMPVLILNNFFGNTFTLYSVAPIGWLLIGWISAGHLRAFSGAVLESHKTDPVLVREEREQFAI